MQPSLRAAMVLALALAAAVLPALRAPEAAAADAKPRCAITRPFENDTVSGRIRVTGTAEMASDPIIRVQLRIDGGSLLIADGTESWSFDVDTTMLQNGRHTIEAKSFDGTLYSDPAVVAFTVMNGDVAAPAGEPPYILVAGVVAISVAVAVAAWRMTTRKGP